MPLDERIAETAYIVFVAVLYSMSVVSETTKSPRKSSICGIGVSYDLLINSIRLWV